MLKKDQENVEKINDQDFNPQASPPAQEFQGFKMTWRGQPIDFWTEKDGFVRKVRTTPKK